MGCSAMGCDNYKGKKDSDERGVSYHHFPIRNKDLLKKWIQAIRRKDFYPKKEDRVCSDHFEDDCYEKKNYKKKHVLKRNAVPTKFQIPKSAILRKKRESRRNYTALCQELIQKSSDFDEMGDLARQLVECVYEDNENSSLSSADYFENSLPGSQQTTSSFIPIQPSVVQSSNTIFLSSLPTGQLYSQTLAIPSSSTVLQNSQTFVLPSVLQQPSQTIQNPTSVILIIQSPMGVQTAPVVLQSVSSVPQTIAIPSQPAPPPPPPVIIHVSSVASQPESSSETTVKRESVTSAEDRTKQQRCDLDEECEVKDDVAVISPRRTGRRSKLKVKNKSFIPPVPSGGPSKLAKHKSKSRIREERPPARQSLRLQKIPALEIPDDITTNQLEEKPA